MRTVLVTLVVTAILGASDVRPAAACSCGSYSSPCEAFDTSVVFVGEVESVQEAATEIQMRLRVTHAVKGITGPTADLRSDTSGCGATLELGKRYVVYTGRDAAGRMSISACSPTRELSVGEPEPEWPPVPRRVYGAVTRYDSERVRAYRPLEPLPDVRLWLDLPTGRVNAVSDGWGHFTFDDVPVGTYAIGVDAGQALKHWMAEPIRMTADGGCAYADVVLHPSGILSGRVVAADGTPAGGIAVVLFPDHPPTNQSGEALMPNTTTQADGRFTFDGLPPDTYVLGANHFTRPGGRTPYLPAYFGGQTRESAQRIRVEPGRTELARPFPMAPALATRQFTIAVACRDGSIPPVVSAEARPSSETARVESEMALRGGAMTLTLLRDAAYTLEIDAAIPYGPATADGRRRRNELLSTLDLPAGMPGTALTVSAPFANCQDRVF
jgi:hypothetical protein